MSHPRPVPYSPRCISLDITTRCNLRCVYCSHFESSGDVDHDLPADEWLKFFAEMNRAAVLEVILSGGEPLVRDDFRVLVEGIVHNRMRFSILSNGTLLNDELVIQQSKTKRFVKVNLSLIPLDIRKQILYLSKFYEVFNYGYLTTFINNFNRYNLNAFNLSFANKSHIFRHLEASWLTCLKTDKTFIKNKLGHLDFSAQNCYIHKELFN